MASRLVLLSGGPVSATLLAEVVNRFDGQGVSAFSLLSDPGEKAHVRALVRHYKVPLTIVSPPADRGEVLPFGEAVLLPIAVGFALRHNIGEIWAGFTLTSEEARGTDRPEFLDAMTYALRLGVEGWIAFHFPWRDVTRNQALLCASRLEVPSTLLENP